MSKKRHSFTILEILIAITILAMALAAVGIQGAKLIRQERFERAMEIVSDQIDFAYELLLLHQTDFTMTFRLQGNALLCSYEVLGNDVFHKIIARPQLIKIHSFFLNNEERNVAILHFSKDNLTEKTELRFSNRYQTRLFSLNGAL